MNTFALAHTLAKTIRANYPTYKVAFQDAIGFVQHGIPVEYTDAEQKEIEAHKAKIFNKPMTITERVKSWHSKK
jgi:hypothetical protein